eukprot:Lithocolla_globosa_v1_NODE_192_length_5318_cov_28.700741.p4 type:complete len:145 gc:universal NODE_192_length_5318_cov_28.700741:3482-3916(+)
MGRVGCCRPSERRTTRHWVTIYSRNGVLTNSIIPGRRCNIPQQTSGHRQPTLPKVQADLSFSEWGNKQFKAKPSSRKILQDATMDGNDWEKVQSRYMGAPATNNHTSNAPVLPGSFNKADCLKTSSGHLVQTIQHEHQTRTFIS